jgi:Domain of unknown function (DUF4169)
MAEIINLRKARKAKARAAKEAEAAENRSKFGRPKGERSQSAAAKDLLDRKLDSHRREDGGDADE